MNLPVGKRHAQKKRIRLVGYYVSDKLLAVDDRVLARVGTSGITLGEEIPAFLLGIVQFLLGKGDQAVLVGGNLVRVGEVLHETLNRRERRRIDRLPFLDGGFVSITPEARDDRVGIA